MSSPNPTPTLAGTSVVAGLPEWWQPGWRRAIAGGYEVPRSGSGRCAASAAWPSDAQRGACESVPPHPRRLASDVATVAAFTEGFHRDQTPVADDARSTNSRRCPTRVQERQSRTTRARRIAASRVASGNAWARAVATMIRSAGSPRNEPGSPSTAITTSRSSGRVRIKLSSVARESHSANGSGSSSRPLAWRICASHMLMAARQRSWRSGQSSRDGSEAFSIGGLIDIHGHGDRFQRVSGTIQRSRC